MPAFEFNALDAAGHAQRGVLQADTPRAARGQLRERGLHPLQVAPVREGAAGSARWWKAGIGGAQLALLSRQLATLVGSGLPIDESLGALAEGSEGRFKSLVLALRARVMEGATLASALAEHPDSFPPLFRASVAAGESAGKLDRVLRALADHAEASDALRQRVMLALTYPVLLTVVALAVVGGLLVYVVPQVTGVFTQHGQALPWPTQALIAGSDWMAAYGGWLLVAILMLVGAAVLALRQPALRRRWDGLLLRLPIFGRLLRAAESSRFARTLALLTGSAVPLLDALAIASQVVHNLPLRDALAKVSARVREGQGFARALAETRQFPPIAVRLIASGEKSGRLDEMLAEAAAHQERELNGALGVTMAALGPGVILLVGGLVLFIVLAILLPIFEMNSLIR
jgi:general secretion pathway protein F